MSEPFIGEIKSFPYKLVPRGWVRCDGQSMQIVDHPRLFKVIGFTYGGDLDEQIFSVPDFESTRVAIGRGHGPGLTDRPIGSVGGESQVTITDDTLPAHTHLLKADSGDATTSSFAGNYLAGNNRSFSDKGPNSKTSLNANSLLPAGNGYPHNNIQPYLELNYFIAVTGQYAPPPD